MNVAFADGMLIPSAPSFSSHSVRLPSQLIKWGMNDAERELHSWAREVEHQMPGKIQAARKRAHRVLLIRLIVGALLFMANVVSMTGLISLPAEVTGWLLLALIIPFIGARGRHVKALEQEAATLKQLMVMKHYASAIVLSPDGIDDERYEHMKSLGIDLDERSDQEEEQRILEADRRGEMNWI